MNVNKPILAVFWKRVLAFFIDNIILGIFGALICIPFGAFFSQLDGWGKLVGLTVAVLYFGMFNSHLFQGQTIGKKLFQIKVVDQNLNCLSYTKSTIRALILETPFILNGIILPSHIDTLPVQIIFTILIFGLGGSIIYFYLFNQRTRQSTHDLLVGSYVVSTSNSVSLSNLSIMKKHYWICSSLIVVLLLVATVLTNITNSLGIVQRLSPIREALQKQPGVLNAGIQENYTFSSKSGKSSQLNAQLYYPMNKKVSKQEMIDAAQIIIKMHPQAQEKELIIIHVISGYDIGIASYWTSKFEAHTPDGWKSLMITKQKAKQ